MTEASHPAKTLGLDSRHADFASESGMRRSGIRNGPRRGDNETSMQREACNWPSSSLFFKSSVPHSRIPYLNCCRFPRGCTSAAKSASNLSRTGLLQPAKRVTGNSPGSASGGATSAVLG